MIISLKKSINFIEAQRLIQQTKLLIFIIFDSAVNFVKMSVNKILKKRRQQAQHQQQGQGYQQQRPQFQNTLHEPVRMTQQQTRLEQQFEQYAAYGDYNPSSYSYSNTYLPYNASMYNRFKLPICIFLPPVSYQMDPVERSIDKIPRCGSCRAYMNYYNEVKKKSYNCFVCGRENGFLTDYVVDADNIQLNQPSYHVLGGQNVYLEAPPETTLIFLVDMNSSSFHSKMLYYFVTVAKQILSRQQLDQTQIYFFTYDEVVHQYDFSGQQVKCTIFDPTIKQSLGKSQENFLGNIREKLFNLLDSLQQIAENNKKQGSNFFQAITYVHEAIKHTGGKLFIFQCNEAISGQAFTNEYVKNANNQVEAKPKSFLETRNKTFFNTFIQNFLNQSISCSFFIFQKNYKNIRVLSDLCKLTNSQLIAYRKDSPEDLMKFYYQFYYLLGASYYSDVRMQLILSPGWYFTAVYGNLYRIKQYISFKFCHLEPSKRVCVCILPQESNQLSYCAMQVITNYRYNRQHFVALNTVVLPLTTSLQKLYTNQDYTISAACLQKTYLSSLRLQEINMLKNKVTKQVSLIWKAANQFYKKKVTPQINGLILSMLGLLKSTHFQLESINDSIVLDSVITQRNYLQSCGHTQVQNFFSPYLFNLGEMSQQMCRDQENFVYPDVCELKFASVKEGIYLLDNGLSLYLYISKVCNPAFLKMLFGKQKFSKNEHLMEENILDNNLFAQQVTNLIRVCREQKGYGWIPLYIVRCGQGTLNQKLFYMNFYAQKYDEFRQFKMTLNQFINLLNQQY